MKERTIKEWLKLTMTENVDTCLSSNHTYGQKMYVAKISIRLPGNARINITRGYSLDFYTAINQALAHYQSYINQNQE